MIARDHRFGLVYDRDAIVRAALRAYVEGTLASLWRYTGNNPLPFASPEPSWTGDVTRGAFLDGNGCGDYDVVAWDEAGVVGLAYELGSGPIDVLGLSVDAVTGGPDDVRAALPELPPELESAFVMAVGMFDCGNDGEKLAGVGFWLHGDRIAGTMFDAPALPGAGRLAAWGALQGGRLVRCGRTAAKRAGAREAAIDAIVDALVDRALAGPTELTTDELETILLSPPEPHLLHFAWCELRQVGIAWPSSREIPKEPAPQP